MHSKGRAITLPVILLLGKSKIATFAIFILQFFHTSKWGSNTMKCLSRYKAKIELIERAEDYSSSSKWD